MAWAGCAWVLLWLGLLSPAWGQTTRTWNGSVSSDWFNANNWTPAGVPATNDTVNFSSGTINFTAPVTIGGVFNWTGGTLSGSGLTVATNGVVNISGNGVSLNTALTNGGTLNWQGGNIAVCCGGPVFNQNGAVWNVQCDQSLYQSCCSGAYFQNAGTVRKFGTTGTATWSIGFNNAGVLTNQSGSINLSAGGSLGGTYGAAAGAAVHFSGGAFAYTTAPACVGGGAIQFTGGSLTLLDDVIPGLGLTGGTLTLSTNFQGGTITNLTVSGANLNGSYTVSGVFNWNNGNVSGALTVAAGAMLNWAGGTSQGPLVVATNGVLNFTGGGVSVSSTLTNAGTVNWFSGNIAVCCGGPFLNLPGALWNVQCDQSLYQSCCSGAYFENDGTVQKLGNTGTTTFSVGFNNSGVVTNQSGTINFNAGGNLGGVYGAGAGTTINFAGGTFTYSPGLVLVGPGNLQLTGGNLTLLDNPLPGLRLAGGTVTLSPTFQGGTITNLTLNGANLNGNYTVSGVLNWNNGNISGALNAAPGGTINWNGGTAQGPVTVATNAVLNFSGGGVSVSSTFTNAGTVNWGSGNIAICCGGPVVNLPGALWQIQCDQSLYQSCCSGAYFENDGTVQKLGNTGTTTFSVGFNNTGVVTNQSGTITFNSGGNLGGVYGARAGTTINFAGGTFTYSPGLVLAGPGNLQLTGGNLTLLDNPLPGLRLAGGTLTLSPTFQGGTITNLTLNGANLNGNYTVSGVLNWNNGNISGALSAAPGGTINWNGGTAQGPVTVSTNAVLNFTGGGVSVSSTFTNAGTVNWGSGNIAICCGGPVVNLPGALWQIQCDQSLYQSCCSGARFQNLGTVQKLANTGTTTFSIPFDNAGAVTNQSGTLNFNGGGTLTGVYGAGAGTVIAFSSGGFSYTIVPTLLGPGAIRFTGGSLTLLDDVIPGLSMVGGSVSLSAGFQGGSITNLTLPGANLSGSYTVSGVFNCGNGVSGALVVTNGAVLNWSGGTINNGVAALDGATVNWAGGTAGGPFTVAPNAVLNFNGGGVSVSSTLTNAGTVNWASGNIAICCGGPVVNSAGALWNVQCDQSLYQSCCSGGYFVNAGTVQKLAASGTTYFSVAFNNTGVLTNGSGTITCNAGGFLGGLYAAGPGTAINFSGGSFSYTTPPVLTGAGAIRFTGGSLALLDDVIPGLQMTGGALALGTNFQGGTITNLTTGGSLSGNYVVSGVFNSGGGVSGSLQVLSGGTLNWSGGNMGNLSVAGGGTLNWSGGTLQGAFNAVPGANINWTGGTSGGPFTVSPNAVVNLAGGGVTVSGTFTNAGTVNWSSGNIGICCGGPVFNLPGALWNVLCDQSLYQSCCSGAYFQNGGTVWKAVTTGTTYFSVPFNNTSVVTNQSGVITFNAGGNLAGVYGAGQGATINFSSGAFGYATVPVLLGPGAIRITGGSLTLRDDVVPGLQMVGGSISLSAGFQGGTITNLTLPGANLNGSYTVSGVLNCGNGVNGALAVTSGAVLNWSGGNISGVADLDGATVNWSGGSAVGPVTIATNAVLNLMSGVSINSTLTNAGTVNWQSGNIGICCGGPVVNLTGALWNVLCDQSLYQSCCSGGSFLNAGTVQKSAATGTTYISVLFYNTGTLSPLSGNFNFSSANVYTQAGATLSFPLGTGRPTPLLVNGNLSLDGTLIGGLANAYVPKAGDTIPLITCGTLANAFNYVNLPSPGNNLGWRIAYAGNGVSLQVVTNGTTTAQIAGVVQDANSVAVTNITVFAFTTNVNNSVYLSATTDGSGHYTLNVTNGVWRVGVQGLVARGYNDVPPQYVVVNNATQAVNFTVQPYTGPNYTITTSVTPPGAGTATGGGVFLPGSQVTLTASANTNVLPFFFVGWTQNGVLQSTNNPFVFTAQRSAPLVANFTLPQFSVSAANYPAGEGTATGAGSYYYSSNAVLTASPNAGYVFTYWGSNVFAAFTQGGQLNTEYPFGSTCTLAQGDTLDFIVSSQNGDYSYLDTGLKAAISYTTNGGGVAVYDAVADFSTNANPAGVWSYGWAANANGTFQLLTNLYFVNGSADAGWFKGGTLANSSIIDKNYTGSAFQQGSSVYAPDTLHINPQTNAAIVRFTAPYGGTFQVSGLFRMQNSSTHAHNLTVTTGNNLASTSPTIALTVYTNLYLVAHYTEATTTHVVSTATQPPGLATVSGAGVYTNGQSGTFSTPPALASGGYDYFFSKFVLTNTVVSTSPSFTRTFSTLDASNLLYTAVYTQMGQAPLLTNVTANFPNPAPATTNYQMAFRFDRSMDTNFTPQVMLTNSAPGAVQPVVPAGGHWGTVAVKNDTFYLPPVVFAQGMDGVIQVYVSGGQDVLGGTLALTNVYTIQLDATPPVLSNVAASPAVLSAFVTWTSDKVSASLVEYGTTSNYGANSGWNNQLVTSHGVTLYNLNPLTTYHYRVHSRDLAGNETISGDNTFTTFAAPDLQVTSLGVSGALISGRNLLINWADTNAGSGATFSYWYDRVVVTNATTGQTLLDTTVYYDPNANGIIAPGGAQARQCSFQLPNGTAGAGNLQVLVTVNAYANQYEANGGATAYANNTAALPFSSTLAAYPDLQITGLAVTNSQVQSGTVVGLVWNDFNAGTGSVSNSFYDQITVVNQTTAQTLLNTTLANNATAAPMGPGQSVARQLSFTLPNGTAGVGTLQVLLRADTYNSVFEYNANGTAESNNTNALTVTSTLAPYADLVVTNVTAPATASAGQAIQVTWVDANQGTAPATNAWTDQIFLADDLALNNEQLLGTLTVTNGLAPSQSLTNVQTVVLPKFGAGQKWLVVRADAGNVIYELNKTNNVVVSVQPIGVAPTLALTVSPASFDQNTPNPAAAGTLTRSGDVSSDLTVNLSNSDPSSLTVPATVTIPAGQYSASFALTAIPSTLVRGNRVVTLTASAAAYQGATNTVTVLDHNQPTLAVSIALGSVGESYPKPIACTVTRNTSTNSSLLVGLVADATKLTVPGTVTIPAGAYAATFYTHVVSNALPTRPVSASIAANVGGYVCVPATVTIVDDDLPNLSLALADLFVTENAQNPASQGTVTTGFASPVPLKIVLKSDNPLITVPPSLQLAAGLTNVTFPVTAVNDHLVHGPTNANITAFIADGLLGTAILDTGVTNALTVIDDNGPALSLSLAAGTISENGATTATVTCNLTPTNDLVLTLASSDPAVATVPATATIPAGHTNVSFTVTGVNPGVPTGPRHASITASASTFATGVAVLNVSDVNLPDLRVAGMTLPATAFASTAITASYSVENDGIWAATNAWTDYVYYSTSPSGANPHFVGTFQMTNTLAVGQAYTNTVTIYLPPNPGQYYLVVNANSGQALSETSYQNNNLVSTAYTDVQPAYRAWVMADVASAPSGTPIPMHGHAFTAQNTNQAAPYVPVTIRVLVKGTRRVFTVNTDINGNFSYVFQPLATEAGSYQLCADHPSVTTDAIQSGFALYGMNFGDGGLVQTTYPNSALTGQVMVQNMGDLPLSGVTAVAEGVTPALGIQVSVSNAIPASGSVPLNYTLTAGSVSSPVLVQARIHVTSAEGAVAYYPLTITVAPKTATLVANPTSLLSAMLRGSQTLVDFDLKNVGGAPSGPIQMLLPQADWLAAACPTNLPSLDPGQSVRVTLSLTPSVDLALQPYSGSIEFVAGNVSLNAPFQFRAVSDQLGDVQVSAQDDYTYYVAGAPLVTNAVVTLTDPYANAVVATGATDQSGQVLLTNIHEGTYQMVVSADHHNSYQSPVTILAGRTNQMAAFLARQTVTYQWTVVPTQIQDNYQVVLESVFETEVPIPVVTVDNPLQIPLIAPGQDTEMDIQISNHGLIAAQGVHFELPTDDPDHEFVVLTTNLDIVPAMSTITVPVIVRARTNSPSYQARVFHAQPRDGTTITGCPKLPKLTLKWGYVCGNDFNWHAVDTEVVPVDATQSCIDAIEDRLKDIIKDLAKGGDWKDLLKWKDQLCALTDALEACGMDPCVVATLRLACGLDSGSLSGALSGALNMGNCFCPKIPDFGSPGSTSVTPPPIGSGGGGGSLGAFNGYIPPVNGANWDWVYSGCTPGQTLGNPNGSVARQVVFGPQPRGVTTSAGAVCAQVRIRIEQQAVVARAAFLGTLTIDNGDPNAALTNIQVTLDIRDLSQNPANDAFGITGPVLLGMTAVDGTGRIEPGASGSAKFTFVPTHSAAPVVPTQYKIGGTLQYYQNDSLVQVPLLPQQITVFPDPVLHLLYFQQRDVYGDDPFTPQIEPSEPFDLGLMVTNSGYGKCFNFTITSGQPKIVDNQKGLLINFSLIGTEVGSNTITPSLTANLGEVDPGAAKVGSWEMLSTLQGHFLEYNATFQHIDSLGNPETSLIDSVEIHELIHKVKADRPGDDAVPDFLVNDVPDPDSLPDTLYLSDGSTAPVNVVTNAISDAPAGPGHMQVQLTATVGSGWNYLQVPDPGAGYLLYRAVRSDGKEMLVTNNVWTTDRSFPSSRTGAVYENLLHLFDWAGPGTYTLYYHSTNTTAPALVAVGPVTPFTQSGPVATVPVTFSEAVDTTTFSSANVSLTRNGGANLLTNGAPITLTLLSNTTYAISGLAPYSALAGNYQLTVNGSGIYDWWGNNAGNVSASTQWANGNVPVVVQGFAAVTPNPRNTPVTAVTVTFSKAINAATFTYQALSLTLNGGPNLITSDVIITPGSGNSFIIGGLGALTGAQGSYVLSVNAAAVQDTGGIAGFGSQSVAWTTITTGPTLTSLEPVTTNPRNTVVRTLNVGFSEPIDPATFDYHALTLTRDGGPNLVTSDVTVTRLNATTFQVGNINWVQGYSGNYTFVVDATAVADLAGNPGTGSTNESWQIILETPPTPANLAITPDLGISATDGLTSTNTVALLGTIGASNLTLRVFDSTTGTDLGTAVVSGTNFSAALSFATQGLHHLRTSATDAAGNVSAYAYFDLFVDTVPPTAAIQPVTGFVYTAVTNIPVTFSEPVNTNTLSATNFLVTLNGTTTFTPTLTRLSPTAFLLGNLASFTAGGGIYQITLNPAGIQDYAGNAELAGASIVWTNLNLPPSIVTLTNMVATPGNPVNFRVTATDPRGLPMTYSLAAGAPAGATLNPTNGLFNWTPTCGEGGTTNPITIWVADHGNPALSNSVSFLVTVRDCVQVAAGSAVVQSGQSVCLPLDLLATDGLTNLTFTLSYPTNRFNNWAISLTNAAVSGATAQTLDAAHTSFNLVTKPGQVLQGAGLRAWVCLSAVPGSASGFAPVNVEGISGLRNDGASVGTTFGLSGRVTVIGTEPLLEATLGTDRSRLLTLYGNPGTNYSILWTPDLRRGTWQFAWNLPLTNLSVTFPITNPAPVQFYRAHTGFTVPQFAPVQDLSIPAGASVVITNTVTNLPLQALSFSLGPSAPAGANINPTNGLFTWTPTCAQGSSTNLITVWATYHATPTVSNSLSFSVFVGDCLQVGLSTAILQTGQGTCIPVSLLTSVGLTNLGFELTYPSNRLGSWAVTATNSAVGSATVQALDPAHAQVWFTAKPGQVLQGPTSLGTLCFQALPGSSAFVQLQTASVLGSKGDGLSVVNATGQSTRLAVIGSQPLLDAALGTNHDRFLTLYGNPGASYEVDYATNLVNARWQFGWRVPMTNLAEVFSANGALPQVFYRALEFSANPPILELNTAVRSNLVLLVYGQKGSNYSVVTGTNLANPAGWSPVVGFTLTNSFQFIPVNVTNKTQFFRAKRP